MKKLLLLVSILCVSASTYAQGRAEREITFERGETSIVERSRSDKPRPDIDHGSARESGGNRQGPVRDPYPDLTQANNAYNRAVAVWQRAYQAYQGALANQARLKERYIDRNGNVRPGLDYYAAVAVLHAADNEAQDAYLELNRAERERNAAYAIAAREFSKATEQYAREAREAAARKAASREAFVRSQRHQPESNK